MTEPESLMLRLLQDMRSEMKDIRAEMKTGFAEVRSEIADVRSEVHSLRADVASDMMMMEKRFGERLTALNRSVLEYHSTVVGHGLLYSELEERVSRLEARMDRAAPEGH